MNTSIQVLKALANMSPQLSQKEELLQVMSQFEDSTEVLQIVSEWLMGRSDCLPDCRYTDALRNASVLLQCECIHLRQIGGAQ